MPGTGGEAPSTNLTHEAIADSRQVGTPGHTILLAWPWSEGPCSLLYVEILGLHLLLVCFGIKPLIRLWCMVNVRIVVFTVTQTGFKLWPRS